MWLRPSCTAVDLLFFSAFEGKDRPKGNLPIVAFGRYVVTSLDEERPARSRNG